MRVLRYVLLSALIMLGCSRVDEIPSFSQIPDSDFTPEDISDWQTYAFIFSDGICTGVEKYPKLSDCRNIDASAGDIVSVIAMESMENISLNDINVIDSKGNRYPALYIKTNGSRIDNMKISGFTVNSQKITSTSENIKIDSRSNVALTVD